MSRFNNLPKNKKAEHYRNNYKIWKKDALKNSGYFIVFNSFSENNILKNIGGNALRLYIFLGLHSGNFTGECWLSIETVANYFNKTPRTISYWIKELEDLNLISRLQLNLNESSHTFLQPYLIIKNDDKQE